MPTNDERRRLAGNMRVYDVVSDAHGRYWLNGRLFGMDITTRSEEGLRNGMAHLASFIDPDTIPDNQDGTERKLSEPEIDRDALLALADELEAQQENKGIRQVGPYMQPGEAARRIRKALGVES